MLKLTHHSLIVLFSMLLALPIIALTVFRAPPTRAARLQDNFQQTISAETLAPTEIATDTPMQIPTPTETATDAAILALTPSETFTNAPTATPSPTENLIAPTETFTPEPTATMQHVTPALTTPDLTPSETRASTETSAPLPTNTPIPGVVRGRVHLQGRADASEVMIYVREQMWTLQNKRAFAIELAPGAYTLTFRRTGYLAQEILTVHVESGATVELPTILLRGGDTNHDGRIDLSDVTQIANQFGAASDHNAGSDVNGDGEVNVLDLVLASANVGQAEFVSK